MLVLAADVTDNSCLHPACPLVFLSSPQNCCQDKNSTIKVDVGVGGNPVGGFSAGSETTFTVLFYTLGQYSLQATPLSSCRCGGETAAAWTRLLIQLE